MATTSRSPSGELVSTALVRHFLQLAARGGHPTAPLLATAGLEPAQLADDDGWLPVAQCAPMVHAVLDASGDPQIALRLSQLSFISGFGIVGYLLESSPTLKEAIYSLLRYERLLSTVVASRLENRPGEVLWTIECSTADPVLVRHIEEFHIGVRHLFMGMVKESLANIVSAVHFRHSGPDTPEQLATYQAVFRCPVLFDQPDSALVLRPQSLGFPLHQMAPGLKVTLEEIADRKLVEMMGAASGSVLDQARAQLRSLLHRGEASRERLAECLDVSSRHLARQLQSEGTSYGELLDEVRLEIANKLLPDPSHTVNEIGLLLGFSDGPSFSRWCRQRTGRSPSDYRPSQA